MATNKQVFHFRETLETAVAIAQAVKHGNTLYVGAVNSMDETGSVQGVDDMEAQLRHCYAHFSAILQAHGAGFENVVKETLYTTDVEALFHAFSQRLQVYEDLPPPAFTVVEINRVLASDVMVVLDAVVELS